MSDRANIETSGVSHPQTFSNLVYGVGKMWLGINILMKGENHRAQAAMDYIVQGENVLNAAHIPL